MTTPSRATASSTHSSSWQTRTGTSSSNTKPQPTANASGLSDLELKLSVQLELRAQLQEEPETDETKFDLIEINDKICDIVKDMDRVRSSLGLSMDADFWGSSDGSQSSAGTSTAQQRVRQQGDQVRQQQAQRGQHPQQQQQPHYAQQQQQQLQQQYAQQRKQQQQQLPLQQLQQRQQHHPQQQGQRQTQQGSHEQGQRPFQQLPQQHESRLDNSEDFQNSFSGFVPRERKRSIGTSLGYEALRDTESSSKRTASGSGTSHPTTFSEPFNASPFAGSDINYFEDDFSFDDFVGDGFDSSPFIDLTGADDTQPVLGQGFAQPSSATLNPTSLFAPFQSNQASYRNPQAGIPHRTSLPAPQGPIPAPQLYNTPGVLPDIRDMWDGPSYNSAVASTSSTSHPSRLARFQLPSFSNNIHSTDTGSLVFPGLPGGLATVDSSRPGTLANGGEYALNNPGSSGTHIPSMTDVISRAATYDFNSMTDAWGNPLDEGLLGALGLDDSLEKEDEIKKLLSNIRPDEDIPPEERGETPPDLKYSLYPHQQLALKWMTDMEEGHNRGGILADDMGLGKTISTLALMASRRAPEGEVATNLIVGPVALIKQWELEIQNKMKEDRRMNVYLYHGGSKKKPWSELRKYDVVLTTYGTLTAQFKKHECYLEKSLDDPNGLGEQAEQRYRLECPMLHHGTKFFRVILDEAQCVKNAKTMSSKAVRQVRANHRWCLTGTPMMNSVSELSSLLRFLQIKPFCEERKFKEAFGSLDHRYKGRDFEKSNAMKQLQALLKAVMLRRMKTTVIDGKPILDLPPKVEHIEHVEFSDEEQTFYKNLQDKSQVIYGRYVRNNTVGKNYSNILVLLLRLRQACCHPHLTDFEAKPENHLAEATMVELAKTLEPAVIDRIKQIKAFECPICYDAIPDPTILLPCGHDICTDCFSALTDRFAIKGIRNGQDGASVAKCPVCRGPADHTKVTNYTSFQAAHMPEALVKAETDDTGYPIGEEGSASGNESDTSDASLGSLSGEKRNRKVKSEGKRPAKVKPEENEDWKPTVFDQLRKEANASRNQDARDRLLQYTWDHWQDSAKVTRVTELVDQFQQSNEKTIIFSQWTSHLDLIECSLKFKLNIKYHRYTGNMPRSQRDHAIQEFVEDPDIKVLLVSLKAGNAGLNLTVASRVIVCDPFWNPFIEDQAVDRAYRIGQKREVHIYKILVEETIEDRIIELQNVKRNIVETALDETQSKQLGRLSIEDLNYLFTGRR
ncbi:SNF2 family N-terminal domain-containing protein [Copromyces sp. CBS 386.78]|nr:SNF2 family N-terminal domain-containing protein [Copromyces sp. CBS 386.78]